MEMRRSFIQMEIDSKDNIKMEKRVEKEFIISNLEKDSKENGSRMKDMEKVLFIKRMGKQKNNFMKMEK